MPWSNLPSVPSSAPASPWSNLPSSPASAPAIPRSPWAESDTTDLALSGSEDDNSQEGSTSILPYILGLGGLAGAFALGRGKNAPQLLSKARDYANAIRMQSMLAGLAAPKSMLGNVGAAINVAAENRSWAPLREVLSRETLKDAWNIYKQNPKLQVGVTLPGPTPGRIMQSFDAATQNALVRSGVMHKADEVAALMKNQGLSAADAIAESARRQAEIAVMQAPLGRNYGPFAKAFDSPFMQTMFPFRRTPFNQFAEGARVVGGFGDKVDLPVLGGYLGVGAAHGFATGDSDVPMTVPLGIAASARYGLPYGVAAMAGRRVRQALEGRAADMGNIPGNVLPVSEYSIGQTVSAPLAPFGFDRDRNTGEYGFDYLRLAPLRALRQILGDY